MSISIYLRKENDSESEILYHFEILYNLIPIIEMVGIYDSLCKPYKLHPNYPNNGLDNESLEEFFEQKNTINTKDLLPFLINGLERLKSYPDAYNKILYGVLIENIQMYVNACYANPNSYVFVVKNNNTP